MIIAALRRVLREAAHEAELCHMRKTHSRLAAGFLYKPHLTVTRPVKRPVLKSTDGFSHA